MKIISLSLLKEPQKIMKNQILNKFQNFSNKNFSERRIVVTGMGTVNPLGVNTQESWENLKKLTSGIRSLENESYGKELPNNCKIGAPIPKHFEAKKYKTLVLYFF
jgi:hypothetical protein